MPWCAVCDRFLSPSTVTAAGACPRCGVAVDPGRARPPDPAASGAAGPTPASPVAAPEALGPGGPTSAAPAEAAASGGSTAEATDAPADDETPLPIPWHFKMLVGAIALYLGWRAFQGIDWLVGRF